MKFEDLIKIAKNFKLNSEEKSRLKARLVLFMRDNPVTNNYDYRLIRQRPLILNKFMAIILIIVLLVGGGTSIAANNSLPGDILYPVKLGMNEKVAGWFDTSAEARAQYQSDLAIRRLEEA